MGDHSSRSGSVLLSPRAAAEDAARPGATRGSFTHVPPRPPNPGVPPSFRSWPSGRRARARRARPSGQGRVVPVSRAPGPPGRVDKTPGLPGSPLCQMRPPRRTCGRYSIGSNWAPACDAEKGKAVPAPQRKPPSSSSPGPQEGRDRRAHMPSSPRSSLVRPTFLQFGYERNPAYPLALLRKHGDGQASKLDPLHEREARPVREP